MGKAKLKTAETGEDVTSFIDTVENQTRRADAHTLLEMMRRVTGYPAKMWGPSIIGFGEYHYVYESGREGDMLRHGFSPRKANMVLYVSGGFKEDPSILDRLGKHKIGKSCLYINKLADIDLSVLQEILERDIIYMNEKYPL